MTEIDKTVFISYRRSVSWPIGWLIFNDLGEHGYDVFMDVPNIDSGQFERIIFNQIAARAHFLVILTPGTLERCINPHDMVRREIELAIELGRNIVPVLANGFDFKASAQYLVGKLDQLPTYNGVMLYPDYVQEGLERLRKRLLKEPVYGKIQAAPAAEQHLVEQKMKEAVEEIPLPSGRDAGRNPILNILPPPFEWCDIPAGRVRLENYTGTFEVKPLQMAKYPVTYAQFQVFIEAEDGFHNPEWWKGLATDAKHKKQPGNQHWQIGNRPRENVSWYDAVAFCRWLTARLEIGAQGLASLREVRLPAEWEWQWAAQGPEHRKYPWGKKFDKNRCNTSESDIGQTTSVTRYKDGESPFRVMDMAGNVWEWCLNRYNNPDIVGTEGNEARQLRGGSWFSAQENARTTYGGVGDIPSSRADNIGFRVCAVRLPSRESPDAGTPITES